ncbi:MAG: DNA-directed RNA polymerase subunit beta [Candidatus Blackburnbacteria bacterium RIFCSPHIGHO2_02_FULL_39_13]|uniref:DNA-directed RNA polymerase subunit beta n=1 Tax=Candidatus Blackburnbacteria bacterium RIFCSPLOWO2_01_FULL_40_20 TaxID=1797519 RepID=A0A1G1VAW8_9BACT|nr:MAG: DNA-directed RNA polymerase subunit beta [Candidatus Blackburnbacteria bacterium RIFCSPHIGHO2_01_FULL_40_17]OGY07881.1 MAG: DNA-directed RNA polymerase subunit beta [Candidatus Blackburnbacteria bacterium RIFCSPHIGHO2_02_FULL_39_13]OGY12598.1 MAG: DNA-directed RNA polymerase subunit beta [Candidatus Blackburnbacteria bacterium RIFCSPLOWO2_01_FULL_40_20]OGY14741.1 MAG: DNA-directed RNA polymerase subunit beta [Candidatus Blackburnbacteria bacterium RIFCSPLOWO2_02_FULL_40_10]
MGLSTKRKFLTKPDPTLTQIDLLAIQKQSWQTFLKDGIGEALREVTPIPDFTGKNWELSFGDYRISPPEITPKKAREKGITYSSSLHVIASLLNKKSGKVTAQEVFLGDVPTMTSEATFVVNGIERAVVNQIVRAPGVYFSGEIDQATGRMLYRAEIRPVRGSWLEFEVSKNDTIIARIDRRRKVAATTLLRAMGLTRDEDIQAKFRDIDTDEQHSYINSTIQKDASRNKEEALLEIYRKMRAGELVVLENAETLFKSLFLDPRRYGLDKVGRYKINRKLGLDVKNEPENWTLRLEDVVAALRYLIGLQNGEGKVDDIDHLANRRVRCVGELVLASAFRAGMVRLERSVKEKMSLTSTDDVVNPSALVNARPLMATLNDFFRSNQLSAILDQTNPLSEIDNIRRLSVMGPGGITKERASFSIRDINASQYGRIDPVRSPEGPSIGLVTYLALFSRVNEFGFLEAPYRKVEKVKQESKTRMKVTNEIIYLAADDEEQYRITHAGIKIDEDGFITDKWVPIRFQGQFNEGPADQVDLIDLTPRQVVGTSASLIPFLSHDEANRALMGTNMQCQAVPLVNPQAPLMGTGMEEKVGSAMARVIRARNAGTVVFADAERIEVEVEGKIEIDDKESDRIKIEGKKEIYFLNKFLRTAQSTCFNQRSKITVGDVVKKGDLIADGPATDDGELALGQNLLIAYCLFEGLGFEDAIAVSDRLVKDDALSSIHIEEYEAQVVDTKLGPEELTRDIPNVAENDLANLAEDGIVVIGAEVSANDILVGKIAPKGETELTSEERLLRAIFGEKAREVRDTSLRVPHGEHGVVVDVQILDRDKGDDLDPGTLKKVIVRVAQMRKVSVGDKLAGRHGNKGVISKIVPAYDMPHLEDGTPIDIIISPLSVIARMNLGQLLEAQLAWVASKTGQKFALPVFDELAPQEIEDLMKKAGLPVSSKSQLYDGRTGEPFQEKTVVGVSYIMKLTHMVEDKTHARSTGPYSLVTQQPLGGKAQMGGQRLGEMEVWALEAHRAAHTLQEMLTIKSDDVVGRARAFEAIVKGTEIPEATVPESFKVLVRELNSLGLSIEPKGEILAKVEEKKDIDMDKDKQSLTLRDKQSLTLGDKQSLTLGDKQSLTLGDKQSLTLRDKQSLTSDDKDEQKIVNEAEVLMEATQ